MSTAKQPIEVIYSAVTDNNLSRALPVLDEGTMLYIPKEVPFGGEYHGRSGFLTLMANVYTLWDNLWLTSLTYFIPEQSLPENSIITTGNLEGHLHGGDALIVLPFVHSWTVKNKKIVQLRAFHWDVDARLNQLRSENNGFDLPGDDTKQWPTWEVSE